MSRIMPFFKPWRACCPALVLMFILAFAASNAQGSSYHWTTTAGDWSLPNNWGGTEPTASDDAYIDNNGTVEITFPGEVCHFLRLGGEGMDKSGVVHMSGGGIAETAAYIGDLGKGTFIQSGGVNAISQILYVGCSIGYDGTYTLSGTGQLSADTEYIGNNGNGFFNQSAGSNQVAHDLYLGYSLGLGIYNLSGTGQLSASNEIVGNLGPSIFNQTGGTNTVSNSLTVGFGSTYTLSGSGSLSVGSGGIVVYGGNFEWFHDALSSPSMVVYAGQLVMGFDFSLDALLNGNQFHGTSVLLDPLNSYSLGISNNATGTYAGNANTTIEILSLGTSAGSGTLNFNGTGTVTVDFGNIGESGIGTVNQTAGTFATLIDRDSGIWLGYNTGSQGTYNLSGTGQVSAASEYVGYSGTGTFNHSAGTNTVTNGASLYLGYNFGSSGTYNLCGTGKLTAVNEYVGYSGTGTFTQTAGTTNSSNGLEIGFNATATGTYYLNGTGHLTTSNEDIGYAGIGIFNHSAGTNRVYGALCLGSSGYSTGNGTYNLSGTGQLTAGSEIIGNNGTAVFNQSGGTNTVYTLNIEYYGTYNLTGGTLITSEINQYHYPWDLCGTFNFGGGTLQASNNFTIEIPIKLTGIGGDANFDTGIYSITLDDSLSGAGGLNKLGSGMLYLEGGNSFSGDTKILGGSLILLWTYALRNSTLDYNTYGGILSFAWDTEFSIGGIKGNQALTLINTDSNAVALTVGGNNQSTTYSGTLSGTGSLTKIGTGTLILTGTNSYSGGTTVNAGILQASKPGALPGYNVAGSVVINNGGTLALNAGGTGEWLGWNIQYLLSDATFKSGSTFGIDTSNATGGYFNYSASIGGNLGLKKLGLGSLTLTGSLTYAGTTTIDQGTLKILTPVTTQANVVLHDIIGAGDLVVGDSLHNTVLTATSIRVGTLTIGTSPGAMPTVPEPSAILLLLAALAAFACSAKKRKRCG